MLPSFDLTSFLERFSIAAQAAGFRRYELLETGDGPLLAWEKEGSGSSVYISAGIHGDEPAGPLAALQLIESGFFADDRRWLICPALNPEGLGTGSRENREGLDLNRDYLVRKSREVSAHAKWLLEMGPLDRFISLHEDWESEGFYFYEINLGDDDPERARGLLSAVSEYFPPEPCSEIDDHEVREPGWIHHGDEADLPDAWPEAIFLAKNGCPLSFTLETPSAAPLEKRVAAHIAGLSKLLG